MVALEKIIETTDIYSILMMLIIRRIYAFFEVVHQFSRLELLDLSSNKLESIPVLDLPSLRTLYLQNNPIKNCYEDFSRLRHLSTLDLGTFDFKEMRRPSRKRKPRENRTITSIEFSTSNV